MQHDDCNMTQSEAARLAKWDAYLLTRGVSVPSVSDFAEYGSLSSLDRLHNVLEKTRPEHCAPLRAAKQAKRKQKREQCDPQTSKGQRGPAPTVSVLKEQVPADWQRTLNRLRLERTRLDAGSIHFEDDLPPPSAASIDDIAWILRALVKSCLDRGIEPVLEAHSVAEWLDDAETRGCKARGLSLQIGLLRRFVILHDGKKGKLSKKLAALRKDYIQRGETEEKRKERFLMNNPRDIGSVWQKSEELFALAQATRPGSRQRQKLFLEAAALALPVVAPLRIGDLGRLVLGESLTRDASGWSMRINTSKTKQNYTRTELWPELTPFLDALLAEECGDADVWVAYDTRTGTPVFSLDCGATGLSGDWISDVWFNHVGCGAHIVRTLWHQLAYEHDQDLTWAALALCGQRDERTAKEYRVSAAQHKAARRGRCSLRAARQRLTC